MEGKFSVIRYLADAARNEPINVGVILQSGEDIRAVVLNQAIRRAISADPQADESALSRLEPYLNGIISEPLTTIDPDSGRSTSIQPFDNDYLPRLAGGAEGKITFSQPQYVELPSSRREHFDDALKMLAARLARPLRQRSVFAPVESPPKKAMRQALRPWINAGIVEVDFDLPGQSGMPRTMDFHFENGLHYGIKHLDLEYQRESQFFMKAQSQAFEFEDVKRGDPLSEWKPMVICRFASDRAEEWVWQVRSIFGVIDCETFDASDELPQAIEQIQEVLHRTR